VVHKEFVETKFFRTAFEEIVHSSDSWRTADAEVCSYAFIAP
jgi:hypothetical protein